MIEFNPTQKITHPEFHSNMSATNMIPSSADIIVETNMGDDERFRAVLNAHGDVESGEYEGGTK